MLNNTSTPNYQFRIGKDLDIPTCKYDKLCSCVFCWTYKKTTICDNCEKLYCIKHQDNHICIISKPVTILTKPDFEPMGEVMILS